MSMVKGHLAQTKKNPQEIGDIHDVSPAINIEYNTK